MKICPKCNKEYQLKWYENEYPSSNYTCEDCYKDEFCVCNLDNIQKRIKSYREGLVEIKNRVKNEWNLNEWNLLVENLFRENLRDEQSYFKDILRHHKFYCI